MVYQLILLNLVLAVGLAALDAHLAIRTPRRKVAPKRGPYR